MKLLVTVIVSFISSLAWTQSVDTIVQDGDTYFVYPFRAEIVIDNSYWGAVKDDDFFLDYNNYFDLFYGDAIFDRDAFKNAKTPKKLEKLNKKLASRWKRLRKNGIRYGSRFNKAVRSNPYELFDAYYNENREVLPPFESIPDGKYVQLFENICVLDVNGMCQENSRIIAAYFSIKNNAIDGEAFWLSPRGDTLKSGIFANGAKGGKWTLTSRTSFIMPGRFGAKELRTFKKTHKYDRSETSSFTTYKSGIKNGPYLYNYVDYRIVVGEYTNGEPSGDWTTKVNLKVVEQISFTPKLDTSFSKRPIIRPDIFTERPINYFTPEDELEKLDLANQYTMPELPIDFYEINFIEPDDIELVGEQDNSHEMTDGNRYPEYDYGMGYGYSDLSVFILDPSTKTYVERAKLIDSLGVRYTFTGTFERYYPNGQLFFSYQFANGELTAEDTIFWDNGTPYDIVTEIPDSNQWLRRVYDRNGIEYGAMIYDSLGSFVHYDNDDEFPEAEEVLIDGLLALKLSLYGLADEDFGGFMYSMEDSLIDSLTGSAIMAKFWTVDTLVTYDSRYNADTRKYSTEYFNVFGETFVEQKVNFTENFGGWTGSLIGRFGDLSMRATLSGILLEGMGNDSIPQRNVLSQNWIYDLSIDQSLYRNDELYTGGMILSERWGLTTLKSKKNKIQLKISNGGPFIAMRFNKATRKAMSKGKDKKRMLLSSIMMGGGSQRSQIGPSLLSSYADKLVTDRREYLSYSSNSSTNRIKKIEGYFENGRANGIWTAFNKKGELISSLNFNHGEADGQLQIYDYQKKRIKQKYDDYWEMGFYDVQKYDSLPKKDVRYLKYIVNYKNGQREGASYEYNWLGDVIVETNYINDIQDGYMYLREEDSYFEVSFKDGLMDGYLKEYLTLRGMDTIQIYDVNFQHGMLNGESKAYHMNGRLAKRGFFLDSEPIDDYEVFDTLGFKYHYIKFKFGFPIEEKIWEENALSIRYQFDWEDSISFSPNDITFTESLQAILVQRQYRSILASEEYFGRPRLLSKEDVECVMTKYFPNDTVARIGKLYNNKKIGDWKFYNYDGLFLYEVNYFDSVININDSIAFKVKGILTDYNNDGERLYSSYIIEKFEKYDCAHTDHYEIRQLLTIDEVDSSTNRMNGYVQNFYDNGTIQSEGEMKNGVPANLWKFYDPYGKLNKMGGYVQGKRHGRWLEGDLAKKKYLGEICMNPNLPDLEEEKIYQENLLDITIINYKMGRQLNTQYYDINMNRFLDQQETEDDLKEVLKLQKL